MKWFGAFWYVALPVVICSLCGCSEQDKAAQPPAGSLATGRNSLAATGAEPAELPTAPASLTGVHPTGNGPIEDAAIGESVAEGSVEQATAIQSPLSATALALPSSSATDAADAGHSEAEREPLFVGWAKPKVALLLTGRQYGYMEPCGCSGLDNQNGGLVRRSTLIKQLIGKGWPVIPIDAGNQVRRFGRQAEIKFQITVEGLRTMGYQAIGFGPDDLRLPGPELAGVVASPSDDQPSLFVGANVEVFDPSFTSPYRVIEKGGKKIGITAVVGERNLKLVHNEDLTMVAAEAGIKRVWPEMEQAKCDLYVLIAHATIEESRALGQAFPQFQLVVTTGGAGEPTQEPEKIEGTRSLMVQVGTKGMFAGVVALFDDPSQPLRYQRIPLDARFPDSPEMLQLLAAYQDQLKSAGFEGLGVRAQPLTSGLKFVGSKSCEECHEEEYKIWSKGLEGHPPRHAHAYATLEHPPNKRGYIPRNFDPECISCHVVGWNPQKYFPYQSGFLNLKETPELTDVGCENCHGPGSQHVASEDGDLDIDDDELEAIRDSMWLDLEDAEQKCLECHDLDNSPAFQEQGAFQRYWEKIEH